MIARCEFIAAPSWSRTSGRITRPASACSSSACVTPMPATLCALHLRRVRVERHRRGAAVEVARQRLGSAGAAGLRQLVLHVAVEGAAAAHVQQQLLAQVHEHVFEQGGAELEVGGKVLQVGEAVLLHHLEHQLADQQQRQARFFRRARGGGQAGRVGGMRRRRAGPPLIARADSAAFTSPVSASASLRVGRGITCRVMTFAGRSWGHVPARISSRASSTAVPQAMATA